MPLKNDWAHVRPALSIIPLGCSEGCSRQICLNFCPNSLTLEHPKSVVTHFWARPHCLLGKVLGRGSMLIDWDGQERGGRETRRH